MNLNRKAMPALASLLLVTGAALALPALAAVAATSSATAGSLEQRVQRLEDIRAINNVIGNFQQHLYGFNGELALPLMALSQPDVRITRPEGTWSGPQSVSAFLTGFDRAAKTPPPPGSMLDDPLSTPLVQVAADGETARGMWTAAGIGVRVRDAVQQSYWNWYKYGVDFKKIDGEWKIWHLHVYQTFDAPYEAGWASGSRLYPLSEFMPGVPRPDRPNRAALAADGQTLVVEKPLPPLPYRTFNPQQAY